MSSLAATHGRASARPGARITSTNCRSRIARAAAASNCAIERDDAAEGRGRIGAIGERVGLRDCRRRCATPQGLACLTMTQAGGVELAHALERRIAVGDVVVGEFLALELPRLRHRCADRARIAVEGGLLVGVLAVAQIRSLAKRQIQIVAERSRSAADGAGEISRHHRVVLRGMRKGLGGKCLAHGELVAALVGRQFVQQAAIIAGVDDHGDRGVILRRRPHHRRSADVDVLDGLRRNCSRVAPRLRQTGTG